MTMTTAECQANLADARLKYHQLMVGGMPRVIVDQNGQRVEFTSGNASGLAAYITRLEGQCGCAGGTPCVGSGPVRFSF